MADGLRYDRQTVGRPSSLAAQKAAKQKKTGGWDPPGNWSLPDSPGQFAKDVLYNEPRKWIVDPLVRTFTGKEATENYLNPEGGLRLPQRAMGVASDALNIASVVPGVRAVAAAPQGALKSALNRMAGRRAAAPVKEFSERAASKAAEAGGKALDAERDVRALLASSLDDPGVIGNIGVTPPAPGTIRMWHTTPYGEALPPQLISMEEAARIPERRGTGANQLLSGGVYATESRPVSASYASRMGTAADQSVPVFPTVPKVVQDDLARLGPNGPRLDAADLENINKMRSRAILNSAIDIDSEVPEIAKNRLISWLMQGGRRNDAALQESLSGLNTWRDFLDFENIGEEFMRPAWTQLVYDNAQAPLTFQSNQPTMFSLKNNPEAIGLSRVFDIPKGKRGVLVDADNPLYIGKTYPTGPNSELEEQISGLARNYADKKFRETQLEFNQSTGSLIKQHQELASRLGEAGLSRRESSLIKAQLQNIKEAIRGHAMFRKTYETELMRSPLYNPYTSPELSRIRGGQISIDSEWTPGQNYWDLPVERAGDRISAMAGMPALDLGNMTPRQVDDLFDAVRGFLQSRNVPNVDTYLNPHGPIGEYADMLLAPDAEPGVKLEAFRELVAAVSEAAQRHGSSRVADELTDKELLYNYLTDYMGINAMPHPGGVVVGGLGEHQAAVFNRPELLPPSTYVPGGNKLLEQALQRYNLERTNRFYADRANQGVGRPWQIAPQASQAPIDLSKMLALNMAARPGLNSRKTGTPVR